MGLYRGDCKLPELRRKRGWTQDDVLDRLKKTPYEIVITKTTLSRYETNKKQIPDVTRRALALIFKCKMDDFYDYPVE